MATSPLQIVIASQVGERFLVNNSDKAIRRLVYALGYSYGDWDGTTLIDPNDPHYELQDIPAHSYVPIGGVDSEEEGVAWWHADLILWEDGTETRGEFQKQEFVEQDELPGKRIERSVLPMDLIG